MLSIRNFASQNFGVIVTELASESMMQFFSVSAWRLSVMQTTELAGQKKYYEVSHSGAWGGGRDGGGTGWENVCNSEIKDLQRQLLLPFPPPPPTSSPHGNFSWTNKLGFRFAKTIDLTPQHESFGEQRGDDSMSRKVTVLLLIRQPCLFHPVRPPWLALGKIYLSIEIVHKNRSTTFYLRSFGIKELLIGIILHFLITMLSLTAGSDDNLDDNDIFGNYGNKMATLAILIRNLANQDIIILNCIKYNNLSSETMSYIFSKNKGLQTSTESMILIPGASNKWWVNSFKN